MKRATTSSATHSTTYGHTHRESETDTWGHQCAAARATRGVPPTDPQHRHDCMGHVRLKPHSPRKIHGDGTAAFSTEIPMRMRPGRNIVAAADSGTLRSLPTVDE